MTLPQSVSIANRLSRKDLQLVVDQFNGYFDQFEGMFVNRERSLELMRLAIGMRQHVLTFGPPGTAKTKLCDAVFAGITGARKFETELSMFMADDALFGPYDVKRMRDDGVLLHRVEGMLPEAEFARVGETLDASMPLLRTLLGALNERRFRRGQQIIDMPLMTVYCDTNVPPGEYLRSNPKAFAILDRILFMDQFEYLESEEHISEMVFRFQRGITSQTTRELPLETIKIISDLVIMPPGLITDRRLIEAYGNAVAKYRKARAELSPEEKANFILPMISDRRVNFASQMLELTAVLDGRLEASAKDLPSAGHVLCTSETERNLWNSIAEESASAYEKVRVASINDTQMIALRSIADTLARDVVSETDLTSAAHTWLVLQEQLAQITPDNDVVKEEKERVMRELTQAKAELEKKALGNLGLHSNGT